MLIALTSGYFGKDFHAKSKSTSAQARAASADASRTLENLDALQELLAADTGTDKVELQAAVGNALLQAYNQRMPHGVSVNQLTPGVINGAPVSEVTTLAEDVPGSSLKSVKVGLMGSYATYEGLMSYLKAVQSGPVALTFLKVSDSTFEATLRIYGVVQ